MQRNLHETKDLDGYDQSTKTGPDIDGSLQNWKFLIYLLSFFRSIIV